MTKENKTILGAKWASNEDLKEAKLLENGDFILGKIDNEFITENSYMNTLLFAPTGTGRGIAHVLPTLLYWEKSLIIHDIKGENFQLTSGYRGNILKQKIFAFNPTGSNNTNSYNPLDKIFQNQNTILEQINQVLNILFCENDITTNEAKYLITAIILYLNITKESKKTIGEIFRILQKDDLENFLNSIVQKNTQNINKLAITYINGFLKKSENDKQIIKNIAINALILWSNPNIDKNTETSDFSATDFMNSKSTLYVIASPIDLKNLNPLLQIIYTQLISSLTDISIENINKQNGTIFILDEFPSLGKLDIISSNVMTFTRGYKLKLFLIVQNIDQLINAYGKEETNAIIANCPIKICFGTSNENTTKLISNLIGKKITLAEDGKKTVEDLLLPQEIMQLPKTDEIIILNDFLNIYSKKIFYYSEKIFENRLLEQIKINK